MSVVVVTGTGTEVGKTFVAAAVARALHARGRRVAVRKPVQSFAPGDTETDADVLACGGREDAASVCPPEHRFPLPMAPPMAADALGRPPFTVADLVARVDLPAGHLVLVEGAGGLRSPIAHDGDTLTLVEALAPALVVLVADAGLGTINLVRLCAGALRAHALVVHLNRYSAADDLHTANRDWLATREGLEIVTDLEALTERLDRLAEPRVSR